MSSMDAIKEEAHPLSFQVYVKVQQAVVPWGNGLGWARRDPREDELGEDWARAGATRGGWMEVR